jgi:GTP-binding protein HflX
LGAVDHRISAAMEVTDYVLASSDGARLAWLYQHGEVLDRADEDDGMHLRVRMLPADRARFEREA